jgi:transcriptional regulatory protein RtcR
VVLSILGVTLDSGKTAERWSKWRPTVALCEHEDLEVTRLELLYDPRFTDLARIVTDDIARVSPNTTVVAQHVAPANPWDFEDTYAALHDFASAYRFRPEREDYLVHITTGTHVAQICLFLLTESRHLPARLLQTSPPAGKHAPRAGSYAIIDLDLSRYDRISSRFRKEAKEGQSLLKAGIRTKNASFNRMIEEVEHAAAHSHAPILLLGPTGAGKSQLARGIYDLKKTRRKLVGELVEVNCATLQGDQAKSALFGHVRGAFTGAATARDGLLKKAHQGVLFLDEIGELGLDEQAMLLRAIEDRVYFPVGSDREVRSDFQLVAGTNRDLYALAGRGRFRSDLLARIDLWTFELPGLAARSEDIAPNLEYELERAETVVGARVTMSREARDKYLAFATASTSTWLGNFRDLNASVVRMATLAAGGRIDVALVDREIERLTRAWNAAAPTRSSRRNGANRGGGTASSDDGARATGRDGLEALLGDEAAALDPFDRVQLAEVVRVCRRARSLSEAGRVLFAASRTKKSSVNDADRLRKYLARFGLSFEVVKPPL